MLDKMAQDKRKASEGSVDTSLASQMSATPSNLDHNIGLKNSATAIQRIRTISETFLERMRSKRDSLTLMSKSDEDYPSWMLHMRGCSKTPDSIRTRIDPDAVKAKEHALAMREKLERKPVKQRICGVHDENKRLQLQQITWKILMEIRGIQCKLDEKSITVERKEELERQKEECINRFLTKLRQKPPGSARDVFHATLSDHATLDSEKLPLQYAYAYGPVGDLPMHACFLLGLKDVGLRVIKEFHDTAEKISLEYIDDTLAWQVKHSSQHDVWCLICIPSCCLISMLGSMGPLEFHNSHISIFSA